MGKVVLAANVMRVHMCAVIIYFTIIVIVIFMTFISKCTACPRVRCNTVIHNCYCNLYDIYHQRCTIVPTTLIINFLFSTFAGIAHFLFRMASFIIEYNLSKGTFCKLSRQCLLAMTICISFGHACIVAWVSVTTMISFSGFEICTETLLVNFISIQASKRMCYQYNVSTYSLLSKSQTKYGP